MDVVARIAIVYLFLLGGLRVMGKREFGQLAPMELVSLLLIPEILSASLLREDFSLSAAIVGSCTLLLCVFVTSILSQRSRRFEQVLQGRPAVLVSNGKLITRTLELERVTTDDLYAEMRHAGLSELSQVRWAVLEGDGKIAIIPVDSAR
jgi:uncharacterized membrane protein YcaP (DUF421 family)